MHFFEWSEAEGVIRGCDENDVDFGLCFWFLQAPPSKYIFEIWNFKLKLHIFPILDETWSLKNSTNTYFTSVCSTHFFLRNIQYYFSSEQQVMGSFLCFESTPNLHLFWTMASTSASPPWLDRKPLTGQ